jgi:multidrug efflux pump
LVSLVISYADVPSAGIAVQLMTSGVKIREYRPDGADDAVDIRVRYPEHERGIKALDTCVLVQCRV